MARGGRALRRARAATLRDVDVATVEALVAERSSAKIAGEYDTADAIRDRLRNEFGVSVDDRVREWVVDSQPAAAPVVVDEPFVVVDAPTEEPAAAAEEAPAGGQSEAELSALTVPALKDLCRAAGLKVGGKKAELVERGPGAFCDGRHAVSSWVPDLASRRCGALGRTDPPSCFAPAPTGCSSCHRAQGLSRARHSDRTVRRAPTRRCQIVRFASRAVNSSEAHLTQNSPGTVASRTLSENRLVQDLWTILMSQR